MDLTVTHEDTRPMLTPAEAAELANVSRKTVYRLIDRGELRAVHVGRVVRIDPQALDEFLTKGSRS